LDWNSKQTQLYKTTFHKCIKIKLILYKTMPSYPDRWLRLICVPLWSIFYRHIGEPAPLISLLRSAQYYLDLLFIMVAAFILWELNGFIIKQMDKRYSWVTEKQERFYRQALLGFVATCVYVFGLTYLYNETVLLNPAPYNLSYVLSTDIPVNLMFAGIIHLLYTGLWMISYHRQLVGELQGKLAHLQQTAFSLQNSATEEVSTFRKTLLVNQGKGQAPVATEEVAYICIINEMTLLKTLQGQSYTIDASLEQLEGQLSPYTFFRISRQFIVQKKAVKKVESESSGRLVLHLHPRPDTEITVSRRRAADFRQWLDN
jgi:hypothetical protein